MINCEMQVTLRHWLSQYCSHLPPEDRKKAFDMLVNQPGAETIFHTNVGEHVTKVGVKCQVSNDMYVTAYISTPYDNDVLKL